MHIFNSRSEDEEQWHLDEGHLHHKHHASEGVEEELLGSAYIDVAEAFHGFQEGYIDATWALARNDEERDGPYTIPTPTPTWIGGA